MANQTNIKTNSVISQDWNGGYKVELNLTAQSQSDNWTLDFELPYQISEVYGVDLTNNGNGSYTISGQNEQANLVEGNSIESVFIIQDNGGEALAPQFILNNSEVSKPIVQPIIEDNNSDSSNDDPIDLNIPDNSGKNVGQQGKFAYGEALQKNFLFLEANRSGDLGPSNRIQWRSDSTTKDGSTVGRDLEGGYFDAGDHVKFGQPMAASVNMLAWGGVEYTDAYKQAGQFDELLECSQMGNRLLPQSPRNQWRQNIKTMGTGRRRWYELMTTDIGVLLSPLKLTLLVELLPLMPTTLVLM